MFHVRENVPYILFLLPNRSDHKQSLCFLLYQQQNKQYLVIIVIIVVYSLLHIAPRVCDGTRLCLGLPTKESWDSVARAGRPHHTRTANTAEARGLQSFDLDSPLFITAVKIHTSLTATNGCPQSKKCYVSIKLFCWDILVETNDMVVGYVYICPDSESGSVRRDKSDFLEFFMFDKYTVICIYRTCTFRENRCCIYFYHLYG